MARIKKIARRRIDAALELLARIEGELPTGSFITISDGGDEEEIEIGEEHNVEVDDIDVVIDLAVIEFQATGILPKRRKGTYGFSAVFETIFGQESEVVDLAIDLETALCGYQDMIWSDDIENALELIEAVREWIKEETKDDASAE
jgi:hypothetical protein